MKKRISKIIIPALVLLFIIAAESLSISAVSVKKVLDRDVFLASEKEVNSILKSDIKSIAQSLIKNITSQERLSPITIDYPFDKSVFPPEIVAIIKVASKAGSLCAIWLLVWGACLVVFCVDKPLNCRFPPLIWDFTLF